jgi:hypothetical protein
VDSSDSFIAKIHSDGTLAWMKLVSGLAHEYILDMEVDQNGLIYLIGDFGITMMFDTILIEAAGDNDAYICKLSPEGEVIEIESYENLHFYKMVLDGNGQIAMIGLAKGDQVLSIPFETTWRDYNGYGAFLTRLQSDFTADWIVSVCDSGDIDQPEGSFNKGIASDQSNNLYISGKVDESNLDFLCRIDSSGYVLWINSFTGDERIDMDDLFVDKFNHIYAIGEGTVAKLDNNGYLVWEKDLETRFWNYAVDQNGYTYIIYFQHWGSLDGFMIIDTDGEIVYDQTFDELEFQQLVMDKEGNLFCNGIFLEEISVSGQVVNPEEGENYLFGRLKVAEMIGGAFRDKQKPDVPILIYPNPFTTQLTIEISESVQPSRIELIDIHGRILKSCNNMQGNSLTIGRDHLPNGIYVIRIHADEVYTKKVIIR